MIIGRDLVVRTRFIPDIFSFSSVWELLFEKGILIGASDKSDCAAIIRDELDVMMERTSREPKRTDVMPLLQRYYDCTTFKYPAPWLDHWLKHASQE
jgi:hypothetical protein